NPFVSLGVHTPPSRRLPASSRPGGGWRPMANRSNDYLLDRQAQRTKQFFGVPGISGQDAAVQESMGPIVDRSNEHLGSSDSALIRARRLWLDAARAVESGRLPLGVANPASYRVRAAGFVIDRNDDWTQTAIEWLTARPGAMAPTLTER
ncbi:MAG: hypothetical protein KGJ86_18165, partial [Chloroflexota bacterium]|nr:hypothetical protein [Chloroflexota bacterium]